MGGGSSGYHGGRKATIQKVVGFGGCAALAAVGGYESVASVHQNVSAGIRLGSEVRADAEGFLR